MKFIRNLIPDWKNVLLALLSAVLLILSFPDFGWWFLSPFALAPLIIATEREHASSTKAFMLGWVFGSVFFFGTCWWLTFAPTTYAGFPWWLAYAGMVFVAVAVGLFPGLFAGIFTVIRSRFGPWAFVAAPFVWVFTEFLRYWLTGNNWNAVAYSQAFGSWFGWILRSSSAGGIYLTGFNVVFLSALVAFGFGVGRRKKEAPVPIGLTERLVAYAMACYINPVIGALLFVVDSSVGAVYRRPDQASLRVRFTVALVVLLPICFSIFIFWNTTERGYSPGIFSSSPESAFLVAVQPNVPMSGMDTPTLERLRRRHVELAESAPDSNLRNWVDASMRTFRGMNANYGLDAEFYEGFFRKEYESLPKVIVFPESPMNFMYTDDREFQHFIGDFARRNNASVMFNSAEPDALNGKYFNSAVMIGPDGRKVDEYDKIYLLPFGEAVPRPLEGILPGFVGNFSYGREYDLFPIGDAKAGVMICFESHFGQLSREYVRNGADVIIEMTNDGYLGPTPVLRQHLANAVFRAVETNRPVLRVTNVGITAYIAQDGEVLDAADPYQEASRLWPVAKSDGSQTFYVRYGDWFAWLSVAITVILFFFSIRKRSMLSV